MAERRPPRPLVDVPETQEAMSFFEVLDQIAAEHPGIVLMNPRDARVKPAPVERIRAMAQIGVDDPNFPETSESLSRLLFDRRWFWGYERPFGYVTIIERHPESGLHRIVMKEIEEGLPVGRPTLGAKKAFPPLEKARTDAFIDLMAWVTAHDRRTVRKLFKDAGIETYARFLEEVEKTGRKLASVGQPLDPANGLASFEIIIKVLSFDAAELVRRLSERFIRNLAMMSSHVLQVGEVEIARKTGRRPEESARPVASKTYFAMEMDLWPDSPAAIADFFLTSQRHYEALYYPISSWEITVEQLDAVLGDAEAITKLVNASPSNPHKGIVFGWEATMNGILEGSFE